MEKEGIGTGWSFEDGTLRIFPEPGSNGEMGTYVKDNVCCSPWYEHHAAIRHAVLEDGVVNIGAGAFYNCSMLRSVRIPPSVRCIGDQAFHDCASLRTIAVPHSVESVGDYAFTYCTSLTNLDFMSEEPPRLGKGLFDTLPTASNIITVRSKGWADSEVFTPEVVGHDARVTFNAKGVSGDIEWKLEGGILSIGTAKGTPCEMEKYVEDNVCDSPWHRYRSGIHSVSISDGVASVGRGSFYNCQMMRSVKIPSSVRCIGDQAFHDCASLRTVTVPYSVERVGDFAFTYCTSLTDVYFLSDTPPQLGSGLFDTLPTASNIITVRSKGWADSEVFTPEVVGHDARVTFNAKGVSGDIEWKLEGGILSITPIPGTSCEMGIYVKDNVCDSPWCRYRHGIHHGFVSDGVRSIGPGAFYGCRMMRSVKIPSSVRQIGYQAFHDCASLKMVTIPHSVESVGDYAFTYCTSLTDVYFLSDDPPRLGLGMFDSAGRGGEIRIHALEWDEEDREGQRFGSARIGFVNIGD
ncbi:MAG: leucine-rich repeat domain-containing protein [Gudongella sp.]|nr:leucine-rich repeat domain-containing protein [Gudongella sp.]